MQAAIAGPRFKSIRHSTAWDADPTVANPELGTSAGLMADASFREGVAALGERGLVYDAWVHHPQLDELAAPARACPDTQIVVNHVGGPIGIGPYAARQVAETARWRDSIRALAACPNVTMKLGRLAMRISGSRFHEADLPPSSERFAEAFAPRVLSAIEAFGAERCMFESNFPVDEASCSYPVLWNAFKRIVAAASATQKRALFHDTAARIDRLGSARAPRRTQGGHGRVGASGPRPLFCH